MNCVGAGDALGNEAAEAHGADAVLGGSERKDGEGGRCVAIAFQEFRKRVSTTTNGCCAAKPSRRDFPRR
jgi:hypothetical protein